MLDFTSRHARLIPGASFLALLALTFWAFLPGLGGQLIFDDIPNFLPWKNIGDINSVDKVLTFTFSGVGLPGRPLSLLSFLIDDQSWSPDMFALKRTNLAIHLLNFCLVVWLCLKLFRYLRPDLSPLRGSLLALFAAGLWALHPLQVSNVSYVIQRMNLLSTLLELAGLLLFMHGREQLLQAPRRAFLLCSAGIGLCMPLAVLAKENGLLLCVFALMVERFCYAPVRLPWWRIWKVLFLWLPLLAFLFYCLFIYKAFTAGYGGREFTAWERLLTQGPVVADYLNHLLLPRLRGGSLYVDNFPLSHSLLEPATVLAWAALAGLLAAAWVLRRRLPLVSFGIFFYFAGHLMESTALPLELYFEHRNYFPQAGLWIAIAGLLAQAPARLERAMAAVAVLVLAFLLVLTRQNAALWSQPDLQTAVWYHENPGSLRTTLAFSNLLLQRGDFKAVQEVLAKGHKLYPDNFSVVVAQRYVRCYWQDLPTDFSDMPAVARQAPYETASITMLEQMRTRAQDPETARTLAGCRPPTEQQLATIYQALLDNPRFANGRAAARLHEFLAEIATQRGDLNATMHHYDQAFGSSGNPIYPFRQAVILLDAGLPEDAARFAALAESSLQGRQRLLYPDLEPSLRTLKARLAAPEKPSHAR